MTFWYHTGVLPHEHEYSHGHTARTEMHAKEHILIRTFNRKMQTHKPDSFFFYANANLFLPDQGFGVAQLGASGLRSLRKFKMAVTAVG